MPDLEESPVLPPREGEDSKTGTTNPAEPPKRRGRPPGTKNKPKIDTALLTGELNDKLSEFVALPISFISPIAAEVFNERQERTIKAIVTIAAKNPQFAKALTTFLEGSAYFDLIGTVVGMGIGFAVDHGQIEANSLPASVFHIDEIVLRIYEPAEDAEQNGNGSKLAKQRGLMGDT
jgi:hypothetical protein